MRTSQCYLVASDARATTRFDLKSGERTRLKNGGIAEDGTWIANLRAPKSGQLELSLSDGAQTFAYPIPNVTAFNKAGSDANQSAQIFSRQTLRIHADRVELVWFDSYFRWNRKSRKLERNCRLEEIGALQDINGFVEEKVSAITRDGENVVSLDSTGIEWRATRNDLLLKRLSLSGCRPSNQSSEQIQISNYGAFALCNVWIGGANSNQWDVCSTNSGRVLWKFTLTSPTNRAVFSSDEKWLALPTNGLHWEIRDAQSGVLSRTLPRVPNVRGAVFSPDGATLYSVADGVLYRQRAR